MMILAASGRLACRARAGVAVPRSAVSLRVITACGAEREKTCKDQPSCSHPIMHELAGSLCCSGHETFPVCVLGLHLGLFTAQGRVSLSGAWNRADVCGGAAQVPISGARLVAPNQNPTGPGAPCYSPGFHNITKQGLLIRKECIINFGQKSPLSNTTRFISHEDLKTKINL